MSACTHLLTARVSSRPLALKFLNWQSLHEFSLNTDINVCCSGLTCARTLSAPGWWWNKWQLIIQHTALALNKSEWFVHFFFSFHSCYCNVLGSQNAHPLKETYISRTLFVYMLFITNHITHALSDLRWSAVLARAEPCVENSSVRFFSANRAIPIYDLWNMSTLHAFLTMISLIINIYCIKHPYLSMPMLIRVLKTWKVLI